MSPSKIEKELSVSFEGIAFSIRIELKLCNTNQTLEYLAVSAVAFNWADSYDAKVRAIRDFLPRAVF